MASVQAKNEREMDERSDGFIGLLDEALSVQTVMGLNLVGLASENFALGN